MPLQEKALSAAAQRGFFLGGPSSYSVFDLMPGFALHCPVLECQYLCSALAVITVHGTTPATSLAVFLQLRFLRISGLLLSRDPDVNRRSLYLSHCFLPALRFALSCFLRFAKSAFAALLAISLLRLADMFFIRAFADF